MVPLYQFSLVVFGVHLLGLLFLNSQMMYDVAILPPLMNGAFIEPLAYIQVGNHTYLHHGGNYTACGSSLGCAAMICQLSTDYEYPYIAVQPTTCYSSTLELMDEFDFFRYTRITFYVSLGLLVGWILSTLPACLDNKRPHRSMFLQQFYRAIPLFLYWSAWLTTLLAYIFYYIFRNDYSVLTWDYLPDYVFSSVMANGVLYLILQTYLTVYGTKIYWTHYAPIGDAYEPINGAEA
jgi:hypothetical protein